MICGYARIGTNKQSIDRQIRNIKRFYPDAYIFKEAYTGISLDRPKCQNLYTHVKPGDTSVFVSISRMCKNFEEGVESYENLFSR